MQQPTIANPAASAPASVRWNALAAGSWIVLTVWLATSAVAFWYFELSDWRPFSAPRAPSYAGVDASIAERWFRENIAVLSQSSSTDKVTFVHLYAPGCRCNRFTEPHLKRLVDRFQSRGVRFLAAPAPTRAALEPAPLGLPIIHSKDATLQAAGDISAPAALMFDAAGRLIYYGPYSSSAWCGPDGSLVDPILEHALSVDADARRSPLQVALESRGCFCGW